MDLSFLNESVVPVIIGICLCVGYVLKNIVVDDSINKYIPVIMGIIGVALNVWISKSITADVLLGGLISGLSSTGLHQIFKQFIDRE